MTYQELTRDVLSLCRKSAVGSKRLMAGSANRALRDLYSRRRILRTVRLYAAGLTPALYYKQLYCQSGNTIRVPLQGKAYSMRLLGEGIYRIVDGGKTTNGYDSDTWGAAVGVDHAFAKNTVVGVAIARTYGENTPEIGTDYYSAGSIDQDATMVGLYGTHKFRTKGLMNDVKLNAFAAYGWFTNESSRNAIKSGHEATAEWDSNAWVLSASLSRDITTDDGLVVSPYVGVEYTKATMDDATEKGRTYSAEYSADQDYSKLSVKVGVNVSKSFGSFTPYAGIAYINDVSRKAAEVTATGKRATITGKSALPGRDALQLKVGANWQLTESMDLNAGYTAELRDKATEQSANVGIGIKF